MELLTSDEIMSKVLEIVDRAERSVKIASAWIKGRHFEEVIGLVKEKKDKISLEIILRASELGDMQITDGRVFRKIREAGGSVYLCERLHAKFILVDDCELVLGSANFTDSGLSDSKSGNLEAGTYYKGAEDDGHVKKMLDYFNNIKKNYSLRLGDDLVGFVLNPVRLREFEFILLDEKFPVLSYVEIRQGNETIYIGRVNSIYAYDLGFFSNPFRNKDDGVTASVQDFKKILSQDTEDGWRKAALLAYFSDNRSPLQIASAELVCVVQGNFPNVPEYPFDAGLPVYKASRETIEKAFKKGNMPLVVGRLKGTDVSATIDFEEVLKRHIMVTGVTGSGKSYFVKNMIRQALRNIDPKVQIIVFDPHGEYYEELEKLSKDIHHEVFENVLFPVNGNEAKELLSESGFATLVQGNSNEATYIRSQLEKYIRPSLNTALREKTLEEVLREVIMGAPQKSNSSRQTSRQETGTVDSQADRETILEQILFHLKRVYGEEATTKQQETCEKIENVLRSDKPLVIVNLSRVTNPETRTNIAGILLQEILAENRQSSESERKRRLLVIEEAQSFAPERSYGGDASAGKDNLSLTTLQRIATEGRKFDVGLIVVTQRPAQVSKYILSQMNSQVVFRTISKQNLDALENFMEHTGRGIVELAPSLPTGVGIISGVAVPFSIVFEVTGCE